MEMDGETAEDVGRMYCSGVVELCIIVICTSLRGASIPGIEVVVVEVRARASCASATGTENEALPVLAVSDLVL